MLLTKEHCITKLMINKITDEILMSLFTITIGDNHTIYVCKWCLTVAAHKKTFDIRLEGNGFTIDRSILNNEACDTVIRTMVTSLVWELACQ